MSKKKKKKKEEPRSKLQLSISKRYVCIVKIRKNEKPKKKFLNYIALQSSLQCRTIAEKKT